MSTQMNRAILTLTCLATALVAGASGLAVLTHAPRAPLAAERNATALVLPATAVDWDSPDSSTTADVGALVAAQAPDAGARTPLRVVTVTVVADRPQVEVTEVTGVDAAQAAVARAQDGEGVVAVGIDTRVTTLAVDPWRPRQWALDRLDAEDTWRHASGAGVKVAVVDTGVAASHPDLTGQVLPGAQFLNSGSSCASSGDGRVDPHGHGTHVAGTVAAVKGNGIGVAGLAPAASVLPIRVLDSSGAGWSSDIACGIVFAVNRGAKVVNLSLGGPTADSSIRAAVDYALSKDVVVVAAAGNDRDYDPNTRTYPAAHPGVIGVAATRVDHGTGNFSEIGDYVDIAAPGVDIVSTYRGGYAFLDGTSMASPHVAAVAAAMFDAADGTATAADVTRILFQTAVDRGKTGYDEEFGHGEVSLNRAVCSLTVCTDPQPDPTPTPTPETQPAPDPEPARLAPVQVVPTKSGGYLWRGQRRTVRVKVTSDGTRLAGHRVVFDRTTAQGRSLRPRAAWTNERGVASLRLRPGRTLHVTASTPKTATTADATAPWRVTWRVMPRVDVAYRSGWVQVEMPRVDGQRVIVQRLRDGSWTRFRSVRMPQSGRVQMTGLPVGVYRVKVSGAPGLASVTSGSWMNR